MHRCTVDGRCTGTAVRLMAAVSVPVYRCTIDGRCPRPSLSAPSKPPRHKLLTPTGMLFGVSGLLLSLLLTLPPHQAGVNSVRCCPPSSQLGRERVTSM